MKTYACRHAPFAIAVAIGIAISLLAGCGGVPPAPEARPAPPKEAYQVAFDQGVTLDFEVEYKVSGINQKSCYAFFTGTLRNHSGQAVSRKGVLDFIVTSQGQTLFRNITHPRTDIPPGGEGPFDFFSSPLHRDGCPPYERIDVNLR